MLRNQNSIELQSLIDNSDNIVFFGGAGVSTESGIPDFRSKDGLYNQKYDRDPEEIISHHFFFEHTDEFYRFYKEKMLYLSAKPNNAHKYLFELEKSGKLKGVITQNIDGLHQMAGNKNVVELHGSIHRNYCTHCHKIFSAEYVKKSLSIPLCDECSNIIKPDVVLYEEPLNEDEITKAINLISNADLLLVCGTSLKVYPAASFLRFFNGRNLVLVNLDSESNYKEADLIIHEKVGELFSTLKI